MPARGRSIGGLMRLILASASPRRVEILKRHVKDFEVIPSHIDEDALTTEDPWETAETLALAKARAINAKEPNATVIGGDTVVALPTDDGFLQLAKPLDKADAERILKTLGGKTHLVITGMAVVGPTGEESWAETAKVTFRDIGDEEIRRYIETGEPMDKAGAYGLQGIGITFVEKVEGDRDIVVGMPTERLMQVLQKAERARAQ
ncbi:MAG: septum formation protein Maf [Armatimonadetes bacterium]|nr:septum formation protein Maf [Armatimonadota bacterium]